MLPSFLGWLDMSVDQAQALSRISFALLIVTVAIILIGILVNLKPRVIHWISLIGFSACLLMGAVTSMLYFWHHWLRR
jgi:hypothetical protein